jgi:hypothetical protein
VIVRDINYSGAVLNYDYNSMSPPKDYQPLPEKRPSLINQSLKPTLNQVGRKVTDQLSTIKSVVGNGLNDLVHSLAPLLDFEEEDMAEAAYVNTSQGNQGSAVGSRQMQRMQPSNSQTTRLAPSSKVQTNRTEDDSGDESSRKGKKRDLGLPPAPPANIDPLLGAEPMNVKEKPVGSTIQLKKQLSNSKLETPSKEPPLPGSGTTYGNIPDKLATSAEFEQLLQKATGGQPGNTITSSNTASSAITPGHHGGKEHKSSLFSPSWFPSSSSKHKKDTNKEKNRLSTGVDLGTISAIQQHAGDGSSHGETSTIVGAGHDRKSSQGNSHEAVGDRLLDLSEELLRVSAALAQAQHLSGGNRDENNDIQIATAKRLQGLADVLAGLTSIVDYDVKFGNKALPLVLPTVTSQGSSSANTSSEPTANNSTQPQHPDGYAGDHQVEDLSDDINRLSVNNLIDEIDRF